jgi:hypothetical protein
MAVAGATGIVTHPLRPGTLLCYGREQLMQVGKGCRCDALHKVDRDHWCARRIRLGGDAHRQLDRTTRVALHNLNRPVTTGEESTCFVYVP